MKYMKELTNADTFVFISKELTYYPELPQFSADELANRRDDEEFWRELSEHLDCIRVCDNCGRPMIEGFCVNDCDSYCSEACLREQYTDEEYKKIFEDDIAYYTVWYEDSFAYNND